MLNLRLSRHQRAAKVLQPVQKTRVTALLVAAFALAASPSAWAQSGEEGPDPSKVKVRIGPLMMTPTISLSNIGIDQNVFNEAPDKDPKKDFTATVTPTTDLWLRFGPSWVTANIKEDIVWYQKYATERAANNGYKVAWRIPLSRLNISTNFGYLSARERVGADIDARAPRKELNYSGAVEVHALTRTFFGVTAMRSTTTYDANATFDGINLNDELSHTTTGGGFAIRQQVTALTTLNLSATRSQDKFAGNPLRDSMSDGASANIQFDARAALKGGATFGYQNFRPLSPDLAEFKGVTMSADLSFVLLGSTRFGGHATRAIQYSYDVNQPYYLETGIDGSVAQQLFGPFDITGRAGTRHLDYTTRAGANVPVPNRTDSVLSYGGGVGFHMNNDLRLGVNIDKEIRTSLIPERGYNNLRIGTALTYGF
jgi:hypothetical protein